MNTLKRHLSKSIAEEKEATRRYILRAKYAEAHGEHELAKLYMRIAHDETDDHAKNLDTQLRRLIINME